MNIELLQQDNTGRIRTLQGARFLFVVLIYMSHFTTPAIAKTFDFGGDVGVSFFFCLSGFVMSWGYGPRVSRGEFCTRRFFWSHFWRLYPLHVLLFGAMLLLDWRIGHTWDVAQMLTSLLLVQSWIPSMHTLYTVNPVSWFLCDILFFYSIFKLLYGWIVRMPGLRLVYCMLGVAITYWVVAWHVPKAWSTCTLYANPLLRSLDFALGIIAYRAYKSGMVERCAGGKFTLRLSVWLLVFWLLYYSYNLHADNSVCCVAWFWPFVPVLITRLVATDGTRDPIALLLASRPLQWLGSISFEIFMVHKLAMRIVQHVVLPDGTPEKDAAYLVVSFGLTVAMAWGLNAAFVKPISKLSKKIISK